MISKLRKLDAAYLAGMIDADGHVSWRGGKHNSPNVGITTITYSFVKWLRKNLGGSISIQRKICNISCKEQHIHRRNDIWKWHVIGHRAVILLRAIIPLMHIKGNKAKKVISLYNKHIKIMQCPARRLHHIQKENKLMKKLGWL